MERDENMSRRSMLKAAGLSGVALALAGCPSAQPPPASGKTVKYLPQWGEFHHVGIPTQIKHENEYFIEGGKVYITTPNDSPVRIEWCRWLPDSQDPEKLRTTVHVAFRVPNCEAAMNKAIAAGCKEFLKPFVPFEGVRVAFVEHGKEGVLIEFLEETSPKQVWPPSPAKATT